MRLGGLTGLVGIAAEQNEVGAVFQGVVDEFIERRKKVVQARGKTGSRVDFPVVLDAEMKVGEMDDFHYPIITGGNNNINAV